MKRCETQQSDNNCETKQLLFGVPRDILMYEIFKYLDYKDAFFICVCYATEYYNNNVSTNDNSESENNPHSTFTKSRPFFKPMFFKCMKMRVDETILIAGGLTTFYHLPGNKPQLWNGPSRSRLEELKVDTKNIKSMGAYDGQYFFIMCDNQILVWGNNHYAQLGTGSFVHVRNKPLPISIPKQVITKIVTSESHTLFLSQTGEVFGCGANGFYQLACDDVNVPYVTKPQLIQLAEKAIDVAVGKFCSFIVTENGKVFGFGNNHFGQIGQVNILKLRTPTLLDIPGRVIQASSGNNHSLFVTEDSKVYFCGSNLKGQAGRAEKSYELNEIKYTKPILIESLQNKLVVSAFAMGNRSYVLTSDGKVYSFGCNDGQLGFDSKEKICPEPTLVQLDEPIKSMSVGSSHVALLARSGNVYTFGLSAGQLGYVTEGMKQILPRKVEFSAHERYESENNNNLGQRLV